jgi:hypothetical protein
LFLNPTPCTPSCFTRKCSVERIARDSYRRTVRLCDFYHIPNTNMPSTFLFPFNGYIFGWRLQYIDFRDAPTPMLGLISIGNTRYDRCEHGTTCNRVAILLECGETMMYRQRLPCTHSMHQSFRSTFQILPFRLGIGDRNRG